MDQISPRNRKQFRILFREFLFRMIDLELLAPEGDVTKLLGQFVTILLVISLWAALPASAGASGGRLPTVGGLIISWTVAHFLISTTMLVVGIFAVLSWDSAFPDRRDVLVLSPLPVQVRTLFSAKVAAVAIALSVSVLALNAFTGIATPFGFAIAPVLRLPATAAGLPLAFPFIPSVGPPAGGLACIARSFAAFWLTMFGAGIFVFCSVLTVQGITQLLPRQIFLRLSSWLQTAFFIALGATYFLQPAFAGLDVLSSNSRSLLWLPSYWFFAAFEQLKGPFPPQLAFLAHRAWAGLAIAIGGAVLSYAICYFRTLRKIAEQPDILPGSRRSSWSPNFGDSFSTALGRFTMRTLLRSRQHRVILSFYFGAALALTLFYQHPVLEEVPASDVWFHENALLLLASAYVITAAAFGCRVVFSMPLAIRANWIFRVLPLPGVTRSVNAVRRALYFIAVLPVGSVLAVILFLRWPARVAAEHLGILAGLTALIIELSLYDFRKIPFTCSYQPGKSRLHMAIIAFAILLFVTIYSARFERSSFENPIRYAILATSLFVAAAAARWRTDVEAKTETNELQFDDPPEPAVLQLGLSRDGALRLDPPAAQAPPV